MDKKVMEISHMAPRKVLVTSCALWYLHSRDKDSERVSI